MTYCLSELGCRWCPRLFQTKCANADHNLKLEFELGIYNNGSCSKIKVCCTAKMAVGKFIWFGFWKQASRRHFIKKRVPYLWYRDGLVCMTVAATLMFASTMTYCLAYKIVWGNWMLCGEKSADDVLRYNLTTLLGFQNKAEGEENMLLFFNH